MAESSNSTVEMGTSDQVLVASKSSKSLTYIIGGIAMLVVVAVSITLVVLLAGNEGANPPEDLINTTEGPTTPIDPSTTTTTPTTTTPTTTTTTTTTETTEAPPTTPEEEPLIDLEDIVNGVISNPSFNGAWTADNEILFRNADGDLVLYALDSNNTMTVVSNDSQILQQSARVTLLSPDHTHVVLAYQVDPVYRYSFVARYAAINVATGEEILIGAEEEEVEVPTRSVPGFLQNLIWGPSGTALAYVFANNIFYQSSVTAEPVQITTSGVVDIIYNGIPDWVYEEEVFGSNNAMWFSPDGSKLAFATFDDSAVRVMRVPHYGVPGSVESQYTLHNEIRYPKPGTNNPTVSVTIKDLQNIDIDTVYNAPSDLTEPILKGVQFVTNETVAVMWSNRVQNSISVQLCTLGNAVCTEIYEYTESDGWVDNIPMLFNAVGNSFITILPQAVDGVLYKQIVQVSESTNDTSLWTAQNRVNIAHTVLEILLWTSNDVIWYKATHVNDSAEQHIYSAAGGAVSCFSCGVVRAGGGACLYNEAAISGDGTRIALDCAGPLVPHVYIYDNEGTYVSTWDDNSEMEAYVASRRVPELIRLQVPAAAGLPDADVHVQVPDGYADMTNVPLLVYVYGGPDSSLVTKQWGIDWGTSFVSRHDVAIAHIDGRGSGLRGVANTFALNRALGSVEIEDQINVTRYLQENLQWVDANRTCIWGWSYGGYAASLALARGGAVFRCAAAVAPVVDWRFYDTIYTERYMDVPQNNSQGYIDSSLLNQEVEEAYRDKRYFLIHGTADDNVHYQHAMLLSRRLQRQDVYFTQMSYTDEDHGLVGVRPHLYHALEKFFIENML